MSTVAGVPLEPGERVIFYHRSDPGWQKPALIVAGIVLFLSIIGIFFLIAGLTARPVASIITNRRFIIVTGTKVEQFRHNEVTGVRKRVQGANLRWIYIDGPQGKGWLSYHGAHMPGIVPIVDRFAHDPRTIDSWPEVAFDTEPLA